MAGGALLQSAATSGNGNEVNCRGIDGQHVLTIIGTGTIAGGAVQWEEALTSGYSGTWAPLIDAITVESGKVMRAVYNGPLRVVRARISTSVTGGGSITVRHEPANWDGV